MLDWDAIRHGKAARFGERSMSLMEKLYLAMVMVLFVSFAILLMTLSWTDAKLDRAPPRRAAKSPARAESGSSTPAAAHR